MIGWARTIWKTMTKPCKEHAHLASRDMDFPLCGPECIGHWLHLRLCGACASYRRQIKRLRDVASTIAPPTDMAEAMPEHVKKRLSECEKPTN